ncbi:MAG: radical family heme chaperone HemW [Bacteroidota bacterium]|jgi:oxygen-independent coproporphyrinogen-3 oxidase
MAGVYFHIPFCRKACHYCDFHFSTSLSAVSAMEAALSAELTLRTDFPAGTTVETVYFGGGTPSLLSTDSIRRLIDAVRDKFLLDPGAEITLEANPDDMSDESLSGWKASGVNRLSIGIQSFRDEDLRFMNRSHTAADALRAVERARKAGFGDLTIDLIYGTPGMNDAAWEENLRILAGMELLHFSAYSLTVEPRTALADFVRKGSAPAPEEEQAVRQFKRLLAWAREMGYEHYEISNFARSGRYSRHNTSYWKGVPYLGIGPSAHSFDGVIRSWNIRNNPEYIRSINAGVRSAETEELTVAERFNEAVLTGLRTMWGIDHELLRASFGNQAFEHLLNAVVPFQDKGWIKVSEERTVLTDEGKLFADFIASELFL